MRKFAALTSLLMITFILTMGGMMALGRATPLPEEIAALHLGDKCEFPCWIGITPGKTTDEDAWTIIHRFFHERVGVANIPNDNKIIVTSSSGFKFEVSIHSDSYHLVNLITLTPLSNNKIPLGCAMNALSSPQSTQFFFYGTELVNNWSKITFTFGENQADTFYVSGNYLIFVFSLEVSRPIQSISIVAKDSYQAKPGDATWQGFKTYSRRVPTPTRTSTGRAPFPTPPPVQIQKTHP